MRSNIVAGLDIGSTKTCAVVAELAGEAPKQTELRILGVGQSRTSGMRREVVTDIEETTASVRAALKEAELMAGVSMARVFAGIAGEHIAASTSSGVVAVADEEVGPSDVQRVHEVARAVVVPADREVLHVLPQEYRVDGQAGIRDPIGMAGMRLEAEVYIVTASATACSNLRKAVSRAGYGVQAFVHEPLATAQAVVTEEEKEVGVALVDLGGSTTELAVFRDGKTRHLATIPWGGTAVTNDLARGLALPFAEAERAKEKYGAAFAQHVDPRDMIELPAASPGQQRQVSRELIAHIIEQRLDEILGLVWREVERSGEADQLGAGVVLTGGGAQLTGTLDVAQHAFGTSVRIGTPGDGLYGLVDSIRRPKFATATGLAVYGGNLTIKAGLAGGGGNGVFGRMVGWMKEFF